MNNSKRIDHGMFLMQFFGFLTPKNLPGLNFRARASVKQKIFK